VVKLRGVNVGEVAGIELQDDGRALITLSLHDGVQVPDTAVASIEPLSIFGPKFVRLDPGDHEMSGPFLGDGDEIAETRTQRELTDILASTTELLGHIDPMDLVTIVDAIAEGVGGMGPQLGRTIDASSTLATVAAAHADDLRQFLVDAAVLTGTLAAHGDDIVTIGEDIDTAAALDDPGRLDQLLDTTTGLSTQLAALLRDNQANLDVTLRSVASFVGGIHGEVDKIPQLIDLLDSFFGRVADVIRMPGPAGTTLGALRGFPSFDLCLIYGICVPGVTSSEAGGSP
jgi:phospholipid/cholesterol/gamma-HCH transport system substrate-binding protein